MGKSIKKWVGVLFFVLFAGVIWVNGQCVKAQAASVQYRSHVQAEGWQGYVKDGATSGTVGKSHAIEAVKIKLQGVSGGINYQSHLQNVGWTSWVGNDAQSGTTGQSRAMEAIRISLTGAAASVYDVYYRVHVGEFGWLGWTKNGGVAGSVGCSMRMEAIQIRLYAKNKGIAVSQSYITRPSLTVQSHIGSVGWQGAVAEGAVSGTVGQSRRIEAMIIRCSDFTGRNGIQYRSHVQNIGWQGWCNSGGTSGTTGRSLQIEAVQIKLAGNIASPFEVYYRVHVGGIGWLGWAKNGATAGTTGGSKRVEAIQIKLVRKGDSFATGGAAYMDLANTMGSPVPAGCKFSAKTNDNGWYGYHDINRGVSSATPVYAIMNGTVTYRQAYTNFKSGKKLTSYGNYIDFTSSDGVYKAKYCHLSRFVGANQIISSSQTVRQSGSSGTYTITTKSVKKGDIIGYIGTTGNSSGIHLHFELRKNNLRVDPTSVIPGLI